MQSKVYIDFEFCRPNEVDMGLICCSLDAGNGVEEFWLLDGSDTERLKSRILELEDFVFVAYNVDMAEGRCFRALGLDPRSFKWDDLMLDWKWLRNGDDRFTYGDVISSDGSSVSWSVRPVAKLTKRMTKEEQEEAEADNARQCALEAARMGCRVTNQAAGLGLLDCEYFFGVIGKDDVLADKETKARIRDGLIVGNRDNPSVLEENRKTITDYCSSDIHLMRSLDFAMTSSMRSVASEEHLFVLDGEVTHCKPDTVVDVEQMRLDMGHWAAQLAMYSARGIPLDLERYGAVKASIPEITLETQLNWNRQHPDNPVYRVGMSSSMLAKRKLMAKRSPYVKFEVTKDSNLISAMIDRYCKETGISWRRTSSGKYSLDSSYLKEMDDGSLIHDYRKHNDSLTSLKAMAVQDDGSVKLDNSIDSKGRQHPNFGPYGTKTGRNATKASTFVFLGPKWFRILVDPKDGTYLCDLDYHSQEVAIAAALYDDDNKREVYRSADVYMKYAQLAGAYPADKPILNEDQRESEKWFKEEHWDRVRKIYKGGFLGMQFGMGGASLQRRVALSLPQEERDSMDPDFGTKFVDEYHNTFAREFECVSELKSQYKQGFTHGIVLADGWRIGPDDPNILSIGNFPVQGTGAVILRRACQLCDEAGVKLYATLHDAISITGKLENMEEEIAEAVRCCKQAAEEVLGEDIMQVGNPEIVRHGEPWLHSSDAKDTWNGMAQKYFKEFVIP